MVVPEDHPFADPSIVQEGGLPIPPKVEQYVQVRLRFEGYHCWPGAPSVVAFLKNVHRHMFHVEVTIQVDHSDRELEFIRVKNWLEDGIIDDLEHQMSRIKGSTLSCEQIARDIGERLRGNLVGNRYVVVTVSEDGENGALVSWQP